MLSASRARTAPTPYPRLVFHGIRIAQALAAIVVSSVMFYFIWNLVHEQYTPPKTFWTLLAASLVTFFFLLGSLFVYACTGLSPLVNLCFNALNFALWVSGTIFLWYYSRATLSHVCNKENWNGPTGIMVCRLYKALFAFATFGTVATTAALILDIFVFRKYTSRGKYSQMRGEKPAGIAPAEGAYAGPLYADARSSIALESYASPLTPNARTGYHLPDEQFEYDSSYNGAHPKPTAASRP